MSVLAWYWPNAILFTNGGVLIAKLDAEKIGSSRSETHVGKIETKTYAIFKKGEVFSATINGVVRTHDSLRQTIVDDAGDILCSDFNYIVAGTPSDVDVDLPDISNMTEDEQIKWRDANAYKIVTDKNGGKIKFFLRDANALTTIEDVQELKNKKWCKSGGGGMVFFGIAIAAIIAIVLYSKLAAKKR